MNNLGEVTYLKAKSLGLTDKNRWEEGMKHHKKSISLFRFLEQHDFKDYNDSFDWKSGGDGDNGETLMYQLDAYFEAEETIFKNTNFN